MASRILAQLLVAGGTMLARAAIQAYRQAVINGQRSGVTAETFRNVTGKQMTMEEARKILGIEGNLVWNEIVKKYEHLMEANKKNGSFYLQSKIYRAMERLEQDKGASNEERKS